jgi:hypothetical protein
MMRLSGLRPLRDGCVRSEWNYFYLSPLMHRRRPIAHRPPGLDPTRRVPAGRKDYVDAGRRDAEPGRAPFHSRPVRRSARDDQGADKPWPK